VAVAYDAHKTLSMLVRERRDPGQLLIRLDLAIHKARSQGIRGQDAVTSPNKTVLNKVGAGHLPSRCAEFNIQSSNKAGQSAATFCRDQALHRSQFGLEFSIARITNFDCCDCRL